ncbi:MAG: hypothetical protein ABIG61_06940 [Planctomycetota bacterium]
MKNHILVNFGFGPIGAALFVNEAFRSSNFSELVVAEIDQTLVDAVRQNRGKFSSNIAGKNGIELAEVQGVTILNPRAASDRKLLVEYLGRATDIATSLPSVNLYTHDGNSSVAALIAEGLKINPAAQRIVYAAENNNYAAELLEKAVKDKLGSAVPANSQFLNTVIGRMSGVVSDPEQIRSVNLAPIVPGIGRAFLVEQFNRILVTRCRLRGFQPGIEVFIEKDDLIPFEEAKLFGHNAVHALLAYLGLAKGHEKMPRLKQDHAIMKIAEDAFLNESGAALIKKYTKLGDELFTEQGYTDYALDLLERMTNPYLNDTIARNARDPVRKLGLDDRIFGTMRLALEHNIKPVNMAIGAAAGIWALARQAQENSLPEELRFEQPGDLTDKGIEEILLWVWKGRTNEYSKKIISLVQEAKDKLIDLIAS